MRFKRNDKNRRCRLTGSEIAGRDIVGREKDRNAGKDNIASQEVCVDRVTLVKR